METDFGEALSKCVRQVRRGSVATCGAIAEALGDVRAARAVAAWIVGHPDGTGAHRIVRADGRPVLSAASSELTRDGVPLAGGRVESNRIIDRLEPVGFLDALRAEQRRLSEQVVEGDTGARIERVAGVDAAYEGDSTYVVATCIDSGSLTAIEIAAVRRRTEFPYIPTYLAYREFPGIEAAFRRLRRRPDAVMVDGHGQLHPALFGIACYVGVRLDLPTIGVAKHRLVGRVMGGRAVSHDAVPVEFDGRVRGYAWTPPGRGRPIFVSVGNRISLDRALEIVRETTRHGYPEPLRLADRLCRDIKRNEKREKGAKQ